MSDLVPFNASDVMHSPACGICRQDWIVGEEIIRNVEILATEKDGSKIIRRLPEVHKTCFEALQEADRL